ncbi:MAG: cell division FtsZ family protein [Lentisphaerae bacterium]|nr:cell division FtsZ family protein [Lentisphaerota bacterium]
MNERICIVGLGGGGGKIIDSVVSSAHGGLGTVAINTDAAALADSTAGTKLQIGSDLTDGFGAGGDMTIGKQAAEGDLEILRTLFDDVKLVFLVAGLGGGTGTGAAPVVLKAAHEAGAMTICFATLPFKFEGERRKELAEKAVTDLRGTTDALVLIPNDRLFEFVGDMSMAETFDRAGQILGDGICAIWKLIRQPGFINLDFADLRKAIQHGGGRCGFGYGSSSGDGKARKAVKILLESPLLAQGEDLARSRAVIVSIVGGPDLALKEISDIMEAITGKVKHDCHISMGTVLDDNWNGRITVVAIASEQWTILPDDDQKSSLSKQGSATNRGFRGSVAGKTVQQPMQTKLSLETAGRGRFKNVEPTILDGEDLDVPTFIRQGIIIEK